MQVSADARGRQEREPSHSHDRGVEAGPSSCLPWCVRDCVCVMISVVQPASATTALCGPSSSSCCTFCACHVSRRKDRDRRTSMLFVSLSPLHSVLHLALDDTADCFLRRDFSYAKWRCDPCLVASRALLRPSFGSIGARRITSRSSRVSAAPSCSESQTLYT